MDKLILKSTTLLAGILISAPMIITTASAATTGGDYTSSANLTLQAGTGPVDPLDPTDPTNPVTPVDPGTPRCFWKSYCRLWFNPLLRNPINFHSI